MTRPRPTKFLLLALLLALSGCGPDGGPVLVVAVAGIPPAAATLKALVRQDGREPREIVNTTGVQAGLSFDLAQRTMGGGFTFGLQFPDGSPGPLQVSVLVLDRDGCALALGEAGAGADAVSLAIEVAPLPAPGKSCLAQGPLLFQAMPAFAPSSGAAITLRGWGFRPGAAVTLAGEMVSVNSSSPTELRIQAPARPGLHGLVEVEVQNADGGRATRADLLSFYLGQAAFSTRSTPLASYPNFILAGDVNGDGLPDLIVSSIIAPPQTLGEVLVFPSRDGKSFGPAQAHPAGEEVSSLALADLDGDGKLDAAVSNLRTSRDTDAGTVTVLRGIGDPKGPPADVYAAGRYPDWVLAADLDRDGNTDLVVFNNTVTAVTIQLQEGKIGPMDLLKFVTQASVLRNLGPGKGFKVTQTRDVGLLVSSGVLADLNGDGYPDLAANCLNRTGGPSAAVFLSDKGRLPDSPAYYSVDGTSGTIAAVDVDGDGKLDLVTSNRGKGTVEGMMVGSISVLRNPGQGLFTQAPLNFPADPNAYFVVGADVNGDRLPDLLVANVGATMNGTISVFLNRRDGSFPDGKPLSLDGGLGYAALAVADFDGDGLPDLALANEGDSGMHIPGTVNVYLNTSR